MGRGEVNPGSCRTARLPEAEKVCNQREEEGKRKKKYFQRRQFTSRGVLRSCSVVFSARQAHESLWAFSLCERCGLTPGVWHSQGDLRKPPCGPSLGIQSQPKQRLKKWSSTPVQTPVFLAWVWLEYHRMLTLFHILGNVITFSPVPGDCYSPPPQPSTPHLVAFSFSLK